MRTRSASKAVQDAVVHVSRARVGSAAELTAHAPPQMLRGELIAIGEQSVRLQVRRGAESVPSVCAGRCSFELPAGIGPIRISVEGPNPELAFTLREPTPPEGP